MVAKWESIIFNLPNADDVANKALEFLNNNPRSITEIEITSVKKDTNVEFTVFYLTMGPGPSTGGWGWKKATDLDDARNFLNGGGAYHSPVREAKIAGVIWEGTYLYYIFYRQ